MKDHVVIVLNAALAAGMLTLVGLGKLQWTEALIGLGLVLTPSAASIVMKGDSK